MATAEQAKSKEFYRQTEENLLAFARLGVMTYLAESRLYEDLQDGGIYSNDDNRYQFGAAKIQEGTLGFAFAIQLLDKRSGYYVLPQDNSLTPDAIDHATTLTRLMRDSGGGNELYSYLAQENVPIEILRGCSVPMIGRLQEAIEEAGIKDQADVTAYANKLLLQDDYGSMRQVMQKLDLVGQNGAPNAVGEALLTHRVVGSFSALTYSYSRLIENLHQASSDLDERRFGGKFSRIQKINAWASNRLIANTVERIKQYISKNKYERVLDLGSGGGFFSLGMGTDSVLFDMSQAANDLAKEAFARAHKFHRVKGIITGSIIDGEKLRQAAAYAPDAVTINYIIHDLLGQADTYQEGLWKVQEFFRLYKGAFGSTPLLLTESWFIDWEDLRKGNKSYITLYAWLHEISPQHLLRKQDMIDMLTELGFEITPIAEHGDMTIDGNREVINETFQVVAVD